MRTFKAIERTETLYKTGFVDIYRFDTEPFDEPETVLAEFIEPENYPIVCPPSLGNPFILEKLTPKDFRTFSIEELRNFFKDFAEPSGWFRYTETVKEQANYVENLFAKFLSEVYYVISPSYFGLEDERTDIAGHAYQYYYLILAFDSKGSVLACQMVMD